MTDEDIKQGAEAIAWHVLLSSYVGAASEEEVIRWAADFSSFADNIIRTLVREAVNEAARTVEEFTTNEWRCPHGKEIMLTGCNLCIAAAVRRLIEGEKA